MRAARYKGMRALICTLVADVNRALVTAVAAGRVDTHEEKARIHRAEQPVVAIAIRQALRGHPARGED
jgi:hypothetical protein